MNAHDVMIVGAGPAGSTCAAQLHRSGFRVKLFDKKVFPRVKPCAGWITPPVIDALQIDIDDYRRQNTFQPITGFRTGILGGRIVETNYNQPVSYGIRRIEFDDYLLRRSGVSCEHETIKQIEHCEHGWRVNGRHTAPLLVGAGGHFCPVARFVREGNAKTSPPDGDPGQPIVVFAQEIEFEMSVAQRDNDLLCAEKPELFFCRDLNGYGWCFRKGNFLNIGLGRTEKAGLSAEVKDFCKSIRSQGKLVDDLPPKFLGHAYRLYAQQQPFLFDEGILLVGDSAGLAYPQSGEGIRPAVESALIAASVVVDAKEDYCKASLSNYAARLEAQLGTPQPHHVAPWLPASWIQNIALRLMATHWFAKNVVIEKWFLNRQPAKLAETDFRYFWT